jgi:predicted TIM-barrel fold metal-dependent hydrolase
MTMTISHVEPGHVQRLTVVSCDSHVGPRLLEDLRPLCPSKYLDDFDRFAEEGAEMVDADKDLNDPLKGRSTLASEVSITRQLLNRQTLGHYDIDTRIREMDWDGVACEVIFHGSQNTEPFPFVGRREWATAARDHELVALGMRIYNRWLSDFVSVQPERHVGLCYVPMWDVDLAVREVEWAAEHGLRGVNFPAPRATSAGEYDDPIWEPFWSACESLQMSLATHAGVVPNAVFGPQRMAMRRIESAGWPARRGMHRLIFGGVFERHPGLKLILTEQARGWWSAAKHEMDSVYANPSPALKEQVPRKPSEYMRTNVFIGGSFMPPSEVHEAIDEGYSDNLMWGRDYPHGEGTYKFPESEDEVPMTHHYLHWAFAGVPVDTTRQILSETACLAYHLDRDALDAVAQRIGPDPYEVVAPMSEMPDELAWHLVDVQSGELAR